MRADNEPQKITIGKLGSEKSISVKKRLGLPGYECRDTNLAYQTKAHSLKRKKALSGQVSRF